MTLISINTSIIASPLNRKIVMHIKKGKVLKIASTVFTYLYELHKFRAFDIVEFSR